MSCLRAGFGGLEIDIPGALQMAMAQGVAPAIAAELLAAFQAGAHAGRVEWKEEGEKN